MREILRDGNTITVIRGEGVTPRDSLLVAIRSGQTMETRGIFWWKKEVWEPEIAEPSVPDLHFDEITFSRLTPSYAIEARFVAIGRDEDRFTLFRNDTVLIANATNIEIGNLDWRLCNFVAISTDREDKKTVHFVDQKDYIATPFENVDDARIVRQAGIGTQTAIAASKGDFTKLAFFDENGNPASVIAVEPIPDLSTIRILYHSDKGKATIWETKRGDHTFMYSNEDLLVEGPGDYGVRIGDDLEKLVFTDESSPARIVLNGDTIFEDKSKIVADAQMSYNGTLVAASLRDENAEKPSMLYYMTPEGEGIEGPFDDIQDIMVYGRRIHASVIEHGIKHIVFIEPAPKPEEANIEAQAS